VVGGLKPEDPRLIGPYRLVGRLGSGGMGQVFLGLSAGGRLVAVKVIRAELAADAEFRVRFAREVAAARRVSGLFTALVVDADVDGRVPWLATAYVAGPSLSQAVSGSGPMPVRPALALAAGLAESLSAIHTAGVVHCDLKPSNVLLSPDGPRVIDFGISRAAGTFSVSGVGWVVGSPGFMSPEQAMGEDVGPPSDIFSLGAVLTFAATGQGPFGRGSRPELAYRLVYGPPDLAPVPDGLRPLVGRCLAKDPAERPTADEVLASAAPPAADWLSDPPLSVLASVPAPREPSDRSGPFALPGPSIWPGPSASPEPSAPSSAAGRRRRWRPLMMAGVAAGVLAAGVAVHLVLSDAARHKPPPPLARAAAAAPASSSASAVPGTRPAPARSSSAAPGPASTPVIFPDIYTVTSPGTPASHPPSPTAHPSRSPSPSPSPTGSSPSPSPSAPSPTGSSPSPSPSSPSPSSPSPSSPSPTDSSPTDSSAPPSPSPTTLPPAAQPQIASV
jgi:eukaryotic-like serine/threonine-protein kinase